MHAERRWGLLNTAFLLGTLGLAAVLVPFRFAHSLTHWGEWVMFAIMTVAAGLGVTAGYHRLYSHRAYRAAAPVRFVLLCLAASSFENSVLQWCASHRVHHRHVDGEQDPYNATRGFWYAHWIWIMEEKTTPIRGVADIERDPIARWQHRHYLPIAVAVALIPALVVGALRHDLAGYLVIAVLLRIVVTHHTTFFINSAAHFFGTRPYTDANSARDNALLAPFTYGEGYHNYHHMWQWDYRNGVKWYHFDPTKWLIGAMAWLGLARDLRRVPDAAIRRARLAMEEKNLRARLARAALHPMAGSLETRLAAARTRLDSALGRMEAHLEDWEARKARALAHTRESWKARREEWKVAMDQHRREVRAAWEDWKAARLAVRRLAAA